MTELELAGFLGTKTTAEVAAVLPQVVADHGAIWFTTTTGVSTFIFAERAMSSDHSPAEAARLWGLGYLSGELPVAIPTGSEGMAGVSGEIIDSFIRNVRGS